MSNNAQNRRAALLKKEGWAGVWTAMVTPFDQSGEIDWSAWEKLVHHQLRSNVRGLVLFGSTGEGATLTVSEKQELVAKTCKLLGQDRSVYVMASTGKSSTRETVELSRMAEQAGADALLMATPAYNKPTPAGLLAHFKEAQDATGLAICLYHIPGRTAQRLSLDTLLQLSRLEKITSIKEATADLQLFQNLAHQTDCAVLSGDDPTYLASLACGGSGLVSVASNCYPEPFVKLFELAEAGNLNGAQDLNQKLFPIIEAMGIETNPGPVKFFTSLMGMGTDRMRSPLAPCLADSKVRMESLFQKYKDCF